MKYYSPSTKGFYDKDFHSEHIIPKDVIEISDQYHTELLEKQSEGYNIVFDGINLITEKVIPTEIELANAYKYDRISEYPEIGDQLDALFHAGVFPPEMAAKIQAVKDKYPKP